MNGTGENFPLLSGNYITKGVDIFLYYIVVNNSDNKHPAVAKIIN